MALLVYGTVALFFTFMVGVAVGVWLQSVPEEPADMAEPTCPLPPRSQRN